MLLNTGEADVGTQLPHRGQGLPAGEAYDWTGFDPRGIGASVPALS
jgi:hypothetical protein